MHDVTHLPPITEQRDFLIPQCRAHKMGNPALLFRAHLMRTIDGAHPEHTCGHTQKMCIVQHILVGRSTEERRGGKECVRKGRSRWETNHTNKTKGKYIRTQGKT